ncbi:MAG: beta-galactosidase [Alistipes sp.]|nr:beta-galactosidase [Alistipes sp.]MBQ4127715.1 beta-galactosidase [Alistipes sp.]
MKRYILLIITLLWGFTTNARETYTINDNWRFFYKLETSSDYARNISLPHTWNLDALGGQGKYLQTVANYQRNLAIPANWEGKRLFVKFHGVQSVADVFINGHHVGEHRGGWTAFTFEITKHVKFGENNSLLVVVNNAYQNDILPTSSEINLYGGIYREVELIVTEQTTISPTYFGSDGVLIRQDEITNTSVSATALVWVTATLDKACDLEIVVRSPEGNAVHTRYVKSKIEEGKPIELPFTIDEPLLWSCDEPNLYTVSIGIGPRQEDVVTVTTGFRKIEYTPNSLKINGEKIPVHGVTLYHDRAAIGSAINTRHYDEDMAHINDIGANAIRSATAPHSQYLYDCCDQMGKLVWIDTPFTRAPYLSDVFYYATDKFKQNGLQQLKEVIIQNYNHPSVVMWGIYSLIWLRGDNVLDYVKELNNTAKQLDSSRPTVACSNQDGEINFVPDLIVWQQNLGWERGSIDDIKHWRENLQKQWSNLRSAVAYGEGGSIDQQTDEEKPANVDPRWMPERWQTEFHEGYTRHLANDSLFWGTWINNMFEFGSVRHTDGISHTGLVSFDRKDEKDSYYLYRALWNKKRPTLYITEKRRNMRQDSVQQVKFYSSAKEKPVLIVNKDTIKYKKSAPCQYISEPVVMRGRSSIVVTAGKLRDQHNITIGNALK